jgi:hypothetical protein
VTAKKPTKKPAPKKKGRPSLYTVPLGKRICERLATGEPLAVICRDVGMPTDRTVRDWTERMPCFSSDIAQARARGFDALAAQCLVIADTPMVGIEEKVTPAVKNQDGVVVIPESIEVKRGDMLGHRKLQIETRLKLLSKWDPKRYGDKLAIGGADDMPPIKTMSDDQLMARIAVLQGRVNVKPD